MKKLLLILFACIEPNTSVFAQVSPDWTQTYNAVGDNSDRYNAMIPDGNGNLYLAGYTFSLGTDKDFLVAKVNSNGDTLWTRTYNHTANLADEALFLTADINGNVYVTGYSDGGFAVSKNDLLTLKYNASGTLLWTARYNYSTVNEDELPAGISVDNAGNVFVTGRSDHDANNIDDMVTVKYNSLGSQQWVVRYNGAANGVDRPIGVLADQAGGCTLGGRYDNGLDDDFILIRYNSSGSGLWTATYNNGFGDDRATAISKDDSGNVYITGRSFNGADDDFTTIKYDILGQQQWLAVYNSGDEDRAISLFVDGSNNVYVTGQTDVGSGGTTNYNFKTVKYNAAGISQWVHNTGGIPNNEDTPESIFADDSGNVYVTGKSDSNSTDLFDYQWMTIKLNSAGVLQWKKFYNGSQPAGEDIPASVYVDVSGTVFICGSASYSGTQKDATLIKYNASGNLLAAKKYNGTGDFTEKVKAMCQDKNNNLYLTGYTMGAGRQRDLFVQKISSSGVQQWFKTYDGTEDNDEGTSIVCDTNGNIYVTGYSNGSGTFDDFITIKYNSNGDSLWTARYNYIARQNDRAVSIAVTNSGIVYVTGYSDNTTDPLITNYDYTTIKYSAGGLELWVARYNGTGNGNDRAVKVVPGSGRVYVTGRSFNGLHEDVVTLEYSTAGVIQHTAVYTGVAAGDDQPTDAVLDGTNLYITGSVFAGNAAENTLTLKYNASLIQQWSATFNGNGDSTDRAASIVVNASGVFITGRTFSSNLSEDVLIIKYEKSNGNQSWKSVYNGSAGFNDRGLSLVSDANGNLTIGGESSGANGLTNALLLNYNSSGVLNWSDVYNGSAGGEDSWRQVMCDASGKIYAGGYKQSTGTGFDIITRRYCSNPVAVINASGPTTFCSGGQVVLNATIGAGFSYQWQKNATNINGATSSSFSATSNGTYTVKITENGNCRSTSNGKSVSAQTVSANISPSGPTTFCNGDSVILNANSGNGLSYQWKKNGVIINGSTAQQYAAKTSGVYKVTVSNSNGCTKVSAGTTVTVNCKSDFTSLTSNEKDIRAYPNPFIDEITLETSGFQETQLICRLTDIAGRVVYEELITKEIHAFHPAHTLENGVYSLQVRGAGFSKNILLTKMSK